MTAVAIDGLEQLDLGLVQVHKSNPRKDVGDLTELAASIKEVGVVEPIVVVRRNGHFEAVAGSRRLAAARKAGLTQIPARVMELDEAKAAAIALIENLQRKDLNPLEEANGYAQYIALTGCTQKDLAEKVGKAPSTIANALRLLKAPKKIQDALGDGSITSAHVRVLLSFKDDSLFAKVDLEDRFAHARSTRTGKGITVDMLAQRVHELNEHWENVGPPAVARAKAKLAEQQQNQKGFTITWQKDPDRYGDRLDLVAALGTPPAKIHGEFWNGTSAKSHDKVCKCRAFELAQDYDGGVEVKRVCIDAKGAAAVAKAGEGRMIRASTRSGVDASGRPTSKAGKAAYVRKRVEDHLVVKSGGGWGRRKPADAVHRRLVAGGYSADKAARLVAYALTVDRCMKVGAEMLELWQRIEKMPVKKVQALVLEHASAIVNGDVLDTKDGGARLAARVTVMRAFGIPVGPKIAEQADETIRKMVPAPKGKA